MSHHRIVVFGVGLFLLIYVGGYLALAEPCRFSFSRGGGVTSGVVAEYRFGGEFAERVFRPMERLDRAVRPAFWATRYSCYESEVPVTLTEEPSSATPR
jgi:hypothetical protein